MDPWEGRWDTGIAVPAISFDHLDPNIAMLAIVVFPNLIIIVRGKVEMYFKQGGNASIMPCQWPRFTLLTRFSFFLFAFLSLVLSRLPSHRPMDRELHWRTQSPYILLLSH